jgi:hypothetical protein
MLRKNQTQPILRITRYVRKPSLEIHEVIRAPHCRHGHHLPLNIVAPLNPETNLEKCDHPCQVDDLNPDGHVLPQRTQPTDL